MQRILQMDLCNDNGSDIQIWVSNSTTKCPTKFKLEVDGLKQESHWCKIKSLKLQVIKWNSKIVPPTITIRFTQNRD